MYMYVHVQATSVKPMGGVTHFRQVPLYDHTLYVHVMYTVNVVQLITIVSWENVQADR